MTAVGIIAEFNPFHKGHAYLIEEARRLTGADYCVVVMSGDFVQRGAPAVCDKFLRTRMAIANGVDAVFELPVAYACASAEIFAEAGVKLLTSLGCTDYIAFGSECGDTALLMECAAFLLNESDEYKELLQTGLRQGLSYPAARETALRAIPGYERFADILKSPNNILAVEYCKAIQRLRADAATLQVPSPVSILRKGSAYSSAELSDSSFSSASAIRRCIEENNPDAVTDAVPESVAGILKEFCSSAKNPDTGSDPRSSACLPVTADMFSDMLHIRLATISDTELAEVAEITPDICNSIRRLFSKTPQFTLTEFTEALKTKNLTYSAISRILFHILLNIDRSYTDCLKACKTLPYARLLGFRSASSPLLKQIKNNAKCLPITKLADGRQQLGKDPGSAFAARLLDLDIRAGMCYDMILYSHYSCRNLTEFERELIIY